MSDPIQKEIEALRTRLAELEHAKAREAQLQATLEKAYQQLINTLQQGEVTLEEFVRCYQKDFRKVVAKIEEGIYAIGFFFPVVAKGQARIRTQLSVGHEKHHLDKALDAFIKIGKKYQILGKTEEEIIEMYGM